MKGNEVKSRLAQEFSCKASDFSVRLEKYSMGQSYYLKIHNPKISLSKVNDYVCETLGLEKIRRCKSSGDILSGGNEFVSVNYSEKARNGELMKEIILERFFSYIKKSNLLDHLLCNLSEDRTSFAEFVELAEQTEELKGLELDDIYYLTRTPFLDTLEIRMRFFAESKKI